MKKIMSLNGYGHLFCDVMYNEKDKTHNPYRIYAVYWDQDESGRWKRHRKQVEKYGDFASVLCYLRDNALGIDVYDSTVKVRWQGID